MESEKIPSDKFKIVGANAEDFDKISRSSLTFWKDARIRLFKNKGAIAGLIIATILISLAIVAPFLSPYTYHEQDLSRANLPPKIPVLEKVSWLGFDGKMKDVKGSDEQVDYYAEKNITEYFYFGTDEFGRDVWTRVWMGARVSLGIGLFAALIELIIGVIYGSISGFFGGRTDLIMQRIVEVMYGIPYLVVVMLIVVMLDRSFWTLILAMVITGWIGMSRIVRAQFLKLKEQEFILAAKSLGSSNFRSITKHLLPNALGPITIALMFTIPAAIFTEAFLSFIGLGIPAPQASLGSLVNSGLGYMEIFPYRLIIPAVVVSLLILSFNLITDGLRDALDPKMRK